MIEFVRWKNILNAPEAYVVVPVNCVGKPGKGLARQWADCAPDNVLKYYIKTCLDGAIQPGQILYFDDSTYILATTKDHWLHPSEYSWIETILCDLSYLAIQRKLESVAVPKLGCGLGRLDWRIIRERMIFHLLQNPTQFVIYE